MPGAGAVGRGEIRCGVSHEFVCLGENAPERDKAESKSGQQLELKAAMLLLFVRYVHRRYSFNARPTYDEMLSRDPLNHSQPRPQSQTPNQQPFP